MFSAIVWEDFSFLNPLNLWTEQEVSPLMTAGPQKALKESIKRPSGQTRCWVPRLIPSALQKSLNLEMLTVQIQ